MCGRFLLTVWGRHLHHEFSDISRHSIASTVTYPLQVIKSRLQQRAESLELSSSGEIRIVKRDYSGVINTITKMWHQERLGGFFKGAVPNAIRVAPGSAITFLVYESVLDFLQY